jgi:ABC-type Zn uptake system ZnuABC Zn-binding protein ZnuA
MRQAIEFVKKHKLKHLLVETSVDKKAMESLSEETKKDCVHFTKDIFLRFFR